MKGFPNQISDLTKIAAGIRVLVRLVDAGTDGRDDGAFGRELVIHGVAGTGHRPLPPDQYLSQQEQLPPSRQSHRTTARGLRELYRILGFIDDSGPEVRILPLGRRAATLEEAPLDEDARRFWQHAFWNLRHGDGASHPYQVLIRLLGRKPRISRGKCALALEARDDSVEELVRIAALAELNEDEIPAAIGVTQSNWANARKVLPAVALQLGNIRQRGGQVELVGIDGDLVVPIPGPAAPPPIVTTGRPTRQVSPTTIARVRTDAEFDEGYLNVEVTPADALRTVLLRRRRLQRHQAIVQRLARLLNESGAELYEDPFDVLAALEDSSYVCEVKTLDGNPTDERERVREALAQLCYYEMFHVAQVANRPICHKVACFERPVSEDHRQFLQQYGVTVIWQTGDTFAGDPFPGTLGN